MLVKDYTGRQLIFGPNSGERGLTVLDVATGIKYFVTGPEESSIPRSVRVQTHLSWRYFTISKIMWNRVVKTYLG